MAYRNVSSATGNSSSPAVSPPSGVAENDIVIVGINYDLIGGSMGTPAEGFTELETASWGGDGSRMWVGWKRATASESTYTFSMSGGAARWSISATAFSGRSTGAGVITDSTSGAGAAPTLTAAAGDDLIYLLFCDYSTLNGVTAFSPPTDFTERAEVLEGYTSHAVSTRDNVSAGATGSVEGSATGATSTYDVLVAIAQGAPATTKKLKLLAHPSSGSAGSAMGVSYGRGN